MLGVHTGMTAPDSTSVRSRRLRWGILGVAKIATEKVIPAIRHATNCEVHAIASRDLARAEQAAAALGIRRAYGSYQALLDDPNAEPAEDDLLALTDGEEEVEEGDEEQRVPDDSEELEMWMWQTRRASLLTPEQEVHLAVRVMAKELADKGKSAELLRLLQRSELSVEPRVLNRGSQV